MNCEQTSPAMMLNINIEEPFEHLARAPIAEAVLFLASDLSSFVTGEILNVNGGAVLCG